MLILACFEDLFPLKKLGKKGNTANELKAHHINYILLFMRQIVLKIYVLELNARSKDFYF